MQKEYPGSQHHCWENHLFSGNSQLCICVGKGKIWSKSHPPSVKESFLAAFSQPPSGFQCHYCNHSFLLALLFPNCTEALESFQLRSRYTSSHILYKQFNSSLKDLITSEFQTTKSRDQWGS